MGQYFTSPSIVAVGLAAMVIAAPSFSFAQEHMNHTKAMDHSLMQGQAKLPGPTEPGQGAFAAIAEIVELLQNDPATDWSKVNITALREHLVDMNELTLNSDVQRTLSDDRIIFSVTGQGRTVKAIQNMVPAHSQVLSETTSWTVEARLIENGAVMVVTVEEGDIGVVEALGFFGIMATGAHHQEHHMMMAKGAGHD